MKTVRIQNQGGRGPEEKQPPLDQLLPDIKKELFDGSPDLSNKRAEEIRRRGASQAVAREIIDEIIRRTEPTGPGITQRPGYAIAEWVRGLAACGDAAVEPIIEHLGRVVKNLPTPEGSKTKDSQYVEFRYWAVSALKQINSPKAENALTRRISSLYMQKGYALIDGSTSAARDYAAKRNDFSTDYNPTEGCVVMNAPFEDWSKTKGNALIVEYVRPDVKTISVYQWFGHLSKRYDGIGVSLGKKFDEGQIEVRVGDTRIDPQSKTINLDEARKKGVWIYRTSLNK